MVREPQRALWMRELLRTATTSSYVHVSPLRDRRHSATASGGETGPEAMRPIRRIPPLSLPLTLFVDTPRLANRTTCVVCPFRHVRSPPPPLPTTIAKVSIAFPRASRHLPANPSIALR